MRKGVTIICLLISFLYIDLMRLWFPDPWLLNLKSFTFSTLYGRGPITSHQNFDLSAIFSPIPTYHRRLFVIIKALSWISFHFQLTLLLPSKIDLMQPLPYLWIITLLMISNNSPKFLSKHSFVKKIKFNHSQNTFFQWSSNLIPNKLMISLFFIKTILKEILNNWFHCEIINLNVDI